VKIVDEEFRKACEFHGHACPGLAIGYRVARYVRDHYPRSEDEELVAIVENNSCSVDAIQQMLSCTFGKGNLVFVDNGKQVFTFYSREKGKALRVYFKNIAPNRMLELREKASKEGLTTNDTKELVGLREKFIQDILNADDEEILSVKEVGIPELEKAQVYPSLICQECGENFMETRGRTACGKIVCKECFHRLTGDV
jgi:formylmethanofuran dehydrogenase subunit E